MLGMAAVGGLLLSLMIWFYYDRQVSGQMDRNAYLEAEIEKVRNRTRRSIASTRRRNACWPARR